MIRGKAASVCCLNTDEEKASGNLRASLPSWWQWQLGSWPTGELDTWVGRASETHVDFSHGLTIEMWAKSNTQTAGQDRRVSVVSCMWVCVFAWVCVCQLAVWQGRQRINFMCFAVANRQRKQTEQTNKMPGLSEGTNKVQGHQLQHQQHQHQPQHGKQPQLWLCACHMHKLWSTLAKGCGWVWLPVCVWVFVFACLLVYACVWVSHAVKFI